MRRAAALVVMVALVATLASCGLPTDHQPRAIPRHDVRDLLTPTSAPTNGSAQAAGVTIRLYFLCGQRISEVLANATGDDPRSVLDAELAGPNDSLKFSGYSTYLPTGTRIFSLDLSPSGVLHVQLSKEMDALSGVSARNAYAQLVFAATGTAGVKQVSFETTNGTAVEVPTDSASKKTVSRADYSVTPPSQASTSSSAAPGTSALSAACTPQ